MNFAASKLILTLLSASLALVFSTRPVESAELSDLERIYGYIHGLASGWSAEKPEVEKVAEEAEQGEEPWVGAGPGAGSRGRREVPQQSAAVIGDESPLPHEVRSSRCAFSQLLFHRICRKCGQFSQLRCIVM